MEIELILSFIGASVILAVMPGPDNIFVLTESLSKGARTGLAISLGLCLGLIVHTLAAATGLSIIIQKSAVAFSVIKYMGASYLFYLAYLAFKEKRPIVNTQREMAKVVNLSPTSLLRKGFFMNVLNPKVSLFFIAFFPQFVRYDGMGVAVQMTVLGIIFMAITLLVFGSIALLSGKLSVYLNSPKFWAATKWGKILVLSALGITLVLSEKG